MAESLPTTNGVKENRIWKGVFAVSGIMVTLVIYGVLQVFFPLYEGRNLKFRVYFFIFVSFCLYIDRISVLIFNCIFVPKTIANMGFF